MKLNKTKDVYVFGAGILNIRKKKTKFYVVEGLTNVELSIGLKNVNECYVFIAEKFGMFQILN